VIAVNLDRKDMEFEILGEIKKMPEDEIRQLFYAMELDMEFPRVRSSKTMRNRVLSEENIQLGHMDNEAVESEWTFICGNRGEMRA
jgi:hypothetical protein